MYKIVSIRKLQKYFLTEVTNNEILLHYSNMDKPIMIKIPFKLDEDCAALMGLMPDGSLIKDLRRIYFHQAKDIKKLQLFERVIQEKFKPDSTMLRKKDNNQFYINSQTLARFFYHILRLPKSDESMRVPPWIFLSPRKVKVTYLREAFAMEGTVLKRLYEIRFITKDKLFAYDIKKLLLQLNISSTVNTRIGGTHRTIQYRLSIYRTENFRKFEEIGFTLPMHIERFNKILKRINS